MYINGQEVIVFGFGDGKEYRGVIKGASGPRIVYGANGLAHHLDLGEPNFYIVEMIEKIPNSASWDYDCMIVVPACVKEI